MREWLNDRRSQPRPQFSAWVTDRRGFDPSRLYAQLLKIGYQEGGRWRTSFTHSEALRLACGDP